MNNGPLNTKPEMGERLRKSRERINEFRAEAQAKARRAARITNNYAHDHPWRVFATGAALAFIAGFLMNTKRPRPIVVKTQRPTIKVKAPKPEKKRSGIGALSGLMPLIMLGLKAYQARQSKNKIETRDEFAPQTSPPIP